MNNDDPEFASVDDSAPKRTKKPRTLSARYLENAAVFYLRRYASSAANLKRVLQRKAVRSLKAHGGDPEQAAQWITQTLETMVRAGMINDADYTRGKATTLRLRGGSQRAIRAKLQQNGLSEELMDAELQKVTAQISERDAALAFAKRRRLGPFRKSPADADRLKKDLAALARAGFSYEDARAVILRDTYNSDSDCQS